MRNLTIVRRKTSVACFAKLKVYIEDELGEFTFNGAHYHQLGELKNGETGVYVIDDSARRVFVCYGGSSKQYCNDTHAIPEGTEDITLEGQARYNPASGNAFRFDGSADEETKKTRAKGTVIGVAVLVVAFAVGIVIGLGRNGFFDRGDKTFTSNGMSITLTEEFEKKDDIVAYNSYYESKDVMVIALQESFADVAELKDYTLDEYAELLVFATELPASTEIHHDNGLTWFEYEAESGKKYNYFTVVYKGTDSFWAIQFVTVAKYADDHRSEIIKWAQSVKVD